MDLVQNYLSTSIHPIVMANSDIASDPFLANIFDDKNFVPVPAGSYQNGMML